jgi:hypothetical protein
MLHWEEMAGKFVKEVPIICKISSFFIKLNDFAKIFCLLNYLLNTIISLIFLDKF